MLTMNHDDEQGDGLVVVRPQGQQDPRGDRAAVNATVTPTPTPQATPAAGDMARSNERLTGNVERLTLSNTTLVTSNRELSAANTMLTGTNLDLTTSNAVLTTNGRLLTDSNAALTASNDELSMFAHEMAHDLKEPIRGVRHLVRFVREDSAGALDKESVARLEQVDRLCHRALTMVNVLLEAARVGGAPMRPEPIGVVELAAEAMEGLGALLQSGEVSVACDDSARTATAYIDRGLMTRALRNLIINAVRHNTASKKSVRIGARLRGDDGQGPQERQLTLTVADNGSGIAPEDAERLFRMFGQLRPVDFSTPPGAPEAAPAPADAGPESSEGIGAGLAIVRKIVERHGGRVWLEHREPPDTGCVFCMTLPRA
jgi:two-component system, chemotaxis family, sensor kinase Cph1